MALANASSSSCTGCCSEEGSVGGLLWEEFWAESFIDTAIA